MQVLSTVSQYAPGIKRFVEGEGREKILCHDEGDRNLLSVESLMWLQDISEDASNPVDPRQKYIEHQGLRLKTFVEHSDDVEVVLNADDLMKAARRWRNDPEAPLAAVMAIEGQHFYQNREDTLQVLDGLGFRMTSLTHHFNNRLGGSSTGCGSLALTAKGVQALEMKDMGWILDLAHASSGSIAEALDLWMAASPGHKRRPVVSHTGFAGQYAARLARNPDGSLAKEDDGARDYPANYLEDCAAADRRNITEVDAVKIASSGGVIGIIYWNRQHGYDNDAGARAVLTGIVRTIARFHAALSRHLEGQPGCIGPESCLRVPASHYIALGSDWDGSVPVRSTPPT